MVYVTKQLNDTVNYLKYLEEYAELQKTIQQGKRTIVNEMFSDIEEESKSKMLDSDQRFYALFTIGIVLSIGGIFFYSIQRKKYKKQKKRFLEIIAKRHETTLEKESVEESKPKERLCILEETEARILESLKAFEKSKQFNDSEISLFNLANQINTNTKYLSEVIKKHKGKSFNQYINHLRIYYIVNCLKNKPEYVKYKISYLANETGFSSHSAFSKIFNEIMGMPPSKFITFLKKQ